MGFIAWLKGRKKPKKIKLGLALGSGGAKGFAELGVIRALEENGLEFDIVAGTSIGSIIGAFYADGYTSTDIFELLKSVDFSEVTSKFLINMDTFGMIEVIDKTIGSLNIEELKKPFKAVATVMETGEEYVFDKGSVAQALSASSCIPPFFKPVVIGDMRFVDGAYSNSIPADLVKGMGADYVLGVDLSTPNSKPSILTKLFPTYKGTVENPSQKGYEYSDLMLHPDLTGYSSTSIKSGSEMYDIGYKTAIENMPKILADIKSLKEGKKKKTKPKK